MCHDLELAKRVRDACLEAALLAYESAGISGLCMEGRWELAVQAIHTLNLEPILHDESHRFSQHDR